MKIEITDTIPIKGDIYENADVSGISWSDRFIVLGSDEGAKFQVLTLDDGTYNVRNTVVLSDEQADDEMELDIEAITKDNSGTHYILGSHSAKRKKVKPDKTYIQNRKRIQKVSSEESRSGLFRIPLDDTGNPTGNIETIKLESIFHQDKILQMFTQIPSKENGIDIEGMAFYKDLLFFGFRGPVLRQNFVPVLTTTFDHPGDYEMRFINLNGKGIRDMAAVKDGLLIIAGPISDGDGRFNIHFWNGEDEIPGSDREVTGNKLLGEIPVPRLGAKAEGITVIDETDDHYKAIIIFDGIELSQLDIYQIKKS